MNEVTHEFQAGLAEKMRGPLLTAGAPGYDEARLIYNEMIDRRPALIAQPKGVADVIACVRMAAEEGLELSVRCGGHNVAGKAVTDGGLMIDMSAHMTGLTIDLDNRTIRAEGGLTWGGDQPGPSGIRTCSGRWLYLTDRSRGADPWRRTGVACAQAWAGL